MKQVLLRGGQVLVEDVPRPCAGPKTALVRLSRSLISTGTEAAAVSEGGTAAYLLRKARDPLNIEKLKRKLATVGVRSAFEAVRDKLGAATAPGYSAAGVVTACGADLHGYAVGDRVACAGVGHASHAEYVVVPQYLLTPIPDGVAFEEAAFVALGAVALHGVRRAEAALGETFVVMGLGLVGLLAVQLLRAAGCHVLGSDPIAARRDLARELGADAACAPEELDAAAREASAGHGVDGVLVCAASRESALANVAIDLCRPRGRVVVVGDVGMDLKREGLYAKEVEFRLSRSYGPGRYDPQYEESGVDYPIGYVRWTEGRNMSAFLRMLAEGRVRVRPLISLVQPVDLAAEAYAALRDRPAEVIAALIDHGAAPDMAAPAATRLELKAAQPVSGSVGVAVIGAGSMARANHLPNLAKIPGCGVESVIDLQGHVAKETAQRFGARSCGTDYREALADPAVQAVLVATRHDTHAAMAIEALRAGKHVFVEKPLALTVADAEAVRDAVAETGLLLTVGFNRRFSRFAQEAKAALRGMPGPKTVLYRCNAGPLPPGHWALDPVQGGGRILGEAVHFFDFVCWLVDGDPASVRAESLRGGAGAGEDNLSVLLRFPDGSVATVVYCGVGSEGLPKERIEIYGAGAGIIIDDFRDITCAGAPGRSVKPGRADKGMYGLLENFIRAVRGEAALEVTASDGLRATRIAHEALADARGESSGDLRSGGGTVGRPATTKSADAQP
ncbi:MAG TPA: bi-domain-containing oxidoreductase [Candidatus Hydrogenedentes bacterium]|nr:bi-domain-containing oxidoreductase [Candidatus Hydrogenedentota bacterium]